MKIEVWSDILCPFCYIGKRRLEKALLQIPEGAEVVYRSFELNPYASPQPNKTMHEELAEKYGMSLDKARASTANMAKQAEEEGLSFNFEGMIPTNSFDAHRLIHFAAKHGKMREMKESLLHACFTESKHIGDHETLIHLAAETGLDPDEVRTMLASDDYKQEVRDDEKEGAALGIRGVPLFVINRKYAISGAQPVEVFVQALQQVQNEEKRPLQSLANGGAACTDETCHVPGGEK